jgi:hypothetical protein
VRRERIAGGILGLAILASIFLLPFSSAISVYGTTDTLYNTFRFFFSSIDYVASLPLGSLTLIAVLYLAGTVVLIIAGVLGTLQRLSGILGVIGVFLTAVGSELSPGYTPYTVSFGIGFVLILGLSLVQLGLWFYLRRRQNQPKKADQTVQPREVPQNIAQKTLQSLT